MRTFFTRQYARPPRAISRTEKTVGILVLSLTAGIVVAFAMHAGTPETTGTEPSPPAVLTPRVAEVADAHNPFPDPGIEGWLPPRRAFHYTPETLYRKINGRADAFLRFHVAALTFGTYHRRDDTARTVDVYWYRFEKPESAMDMYRSEAPPDATSVTVGREGYQAGGAVFFCKGSSYVQVLPGGLSEEDGLAALAIAGRIAAACNATGPSDDTTGG